MKEERKMTLYTKKRKPGEAVNVVVVGRRRNVSISLWAFIKVEIACSDRLGMHCW